MSTTTAPAVDAFVEHAKDMLAVALDLLMAVRDDDEAGLDVLATLVREDVLDVASLLQIVTCLANLLPTAYRDALQRGAPFSVWLAESLTVAGSL